MAKFFQKRIEVNAFLYFTICLLSGIDAGMFLGTIILHAWQGGH